MSKSSNMLRTRRRDNNVKPNRRLDRKSSRGMIYENEELRLKTININAEIERGQSDIKKLKRENEMLKKEIWCLRDEYEKLDKMLKEKEIEFSSSSTTCSSDDSESCSSCTEGSEEVETSQNLENVQKTNQKNFQDDFDHLSVVPEENSTENSDKNSTSNRASLQNNETWSYEGAIKPDQSYPIYANIHKQSFEEKQPKHFFSPIKINNSPNYPQALPYTQPFDNYVQPPQSPSTFRHPRQNPIETNQTNNTHILTDMSYYQNTSLPPAPSKSHDYLHQNPEPKSSTDLIVKTDNRHFQSMTPSQSTFSNGGNLEELLNDIETISQDILKISNAQNQRFNCITDNPTSYGLETSDIVTKIQNSDLSYVQNTKVDNYEVIDNEGEKRPFKSELNVVLMPTPMPLIGFDKYRNLQRSCDSINTKSLEELSVSTQNLRIIPDNVEQNIIVNPDFFQTQPIVTAPEVRIPFGQLTPNTPVITLDTIPPSEHSNPFFFGNLQNTYTNLDYFNDRYNPENYNEKNEKTNSKSNLLDILPSDHVSSENEENLKFGTSKSTDSKPKADNIKSPKLSIRRKVSIHFKGKKDKTKKSNPDDAKPKTPTADKKHPLFDIKFSSAESKADKKLQKTPSIDSKQSVSEPNILEAAKTSSDSKTSTDKKYSSVSSSDTPNKTEQKSVGLTQYEGKISESKTPDKKAPRKSCSISPDRKHVHLKDENKKGHRKHKKGDRRNHRSTMSTDRVHRERSYSVCTDRSNILDHRLGFSTNFLYDDFTTSDRERTNSLSSCETIKTRKMSNLSNMPVNGKIPWCGCWGNGCL